MGTLVGKKCRFRWVVEKHGWRSDGVCGGGRGALSGINFLHQWRATTSSNQGFYSKRITANRGHIVMIMGAKMIYQIVKQKKGNVVCFQKVNSNAEILHSTFQVFDQKFCFLVYWLRIVVVSVPVCGDASEVEFPGWSSVFPLAIDESKGLQCVCVLQERSNFYVNGRVGIEATDCEWTIDLSVQLSAFSGEIGGGTGERDIGTSFSVGWVLIAKVTDGLKGDQIVDVGARELLFWLPKAR